MALIKFENEYISDCCNIFELAELLKITPKTLLFFAYNNKELYDHYKIKKKSGGERIISAPTEALKTICRKLALLFNDVYEEHLPLPVHGFVNRRSIVTNARNHLSKRYVLNIDLKDFFGTINTGRVMGLFGAYPFRFNSKLSSVIAGIVTHNNALPQGSPASPVISNMICRKLDLAFLKLAASNNWVYSRYADDITISSNVLNNQLVIEAGSTLKPGKLIQKIINENGFRINEDKIRLARPNQSKWVTGVKVNDKLNVSRKFIKVVRSMLYSIEKEKALKGVSFKPDQRLLSIIGGKISHVGNVKGRDNIIFIKLYNRWRDLMEDIHKRIPESAREKYMDNVLIIKSSLGYGSGFFITERIIVTAAHVIGPEDLNFEISIRKMKLPVEFKGATLVEIDRTRDFAILHTYSNAFSKSVFNADYSGKNYDYNTQYISMGYGGFRSGGKYWSDVCIVDQKISQIEIDSENNVDYLVSNPMWSGMSGGPVISEKTGLVVGYIVRGSDSLASGHDVKSHIFRPITNIPVEFRGINKI